MGNQPSASLEQEEIENGSPGKKDSPPKRIDEEIPAEDLIVLATVSQICGRIEDTFEYLDQLARLKTKMYHKSERALLFAVLHGSIAKHREASRCLQLAALAEEPYEELDRLFAIESYRSKICAEARRLCEHALHIVEDRLLPAAERSEVRIFLHMLAGDCHRFSAEFSVMDRDRQVLLASKSYEDATELAHIWLTPAHPVRLALALGHSIFQDSLQSNRRKAIEISRTAIEAAEDDPDLDLPHCSAESDTILDLLQEKLDEWDPPSPSSPTSIIQDEQAAFFADVGDGLYESPAHTVLNAPPSSSARFRQQLGPVQGSLKFDDANAASSPMPAADPLLSPPWLTKDKANSLDPSTPIATFDSFDSFSSKLRPAAYYPSSLGFPASSTPSPSGKKATSRRRDASEEEASEDGSSISGNNRDIQSVKKSAKKNISRNLEERGNGDSCPSAGADLLNYNNQISNGLLTREENLFAPRNRRARSVGPG